MTASWPTRLPTEPHSTGRALVEVREIAPRQVMLLIDGMESSFLDLDHPEHLEFEYMQHVDVAVSAQFGDSRPIRALHLGAGACTLARAWDATRPGSAQLAVEWDAELARLVREWFPLPRAPRLRIRTGDARSALEGFPPGRWDVVVRDAFVKGQVPAHLSDDAAWRAMRRTIGAGGLIAANVADRAPLDQVRREAAAALRHVGPAALIAEPGVLKGRRYGNVMIVASPAGLDPDEIARRTRRLPMVASVLAGTELTAFTRGASAG